MFDLGGFLVLTSLSFVAIRFAVPHQVRALRSAGLPVPAPTRMMVAQSFVFTFFMAGLGAATAPQVGYTLIGEQEVYVPLLAGIAGAVLSILGILGAYYGVIWRSAPPDELLLSERLRIGMGLVARMLFGGLVEEVQFRWGLMSAFAWAGSRILSGLTGWLAILLSSIVFSLYHLLGLRQLGTEVSTLTAGHPF